MPFWKKSKDPRSELRQLIGDYELPSFSAAAVSTLSLLRRDSDMSEIVERLMMDPGLHVCILRTVNSAAFGLQNKVTNLEHAANLLGRSRIESLVLSAAVADSLPSPTGFDLAAFWQTAARRACLARRLARLTNPANEVEVFTAALLQDMAVPVLVQALMKPYVDVYDRFVLGDESALHELEQREFGYDHTQIGALMAETWDLPELLVTAIADHHTPDCRAPIEVEAVSRLRHHGDDQSLASLRQHCLDRLKLEAAILDQIIEATHSESVALAQSMGSPAAC